MEPFPPTIILRHRKEKKKKCSLTGLETRKDCIFYVYPWKDPQPNLQNYFVLTLEGPTLSKEDSQKGIFLIDGSWRYAQKMSKSLCQPFATRSLPYYGTTAYPRCQNDCPDKEKGLASVEALYIAYQILGRDPTGLLDQYYWKKEFLFNISNP